MYGEKVPKYAGLELCVAKSKERTAAIATFSRTQGGGLSRRRHVNCVCSKDYEKPTDRYVRRRRHKVAPKDQEAVQFKADQWTAGTLPETAVKFAWQ
jgi:hypothetical protein